MVVCPLAVRMWETSLAHDFSGAGGLMDEIPAKRPAPPTRHYFQQPDPGLYGKCPPEPVLPFIHNPSLQNSMIHGPDGLYPPIKIDSMHVSSQESSPEQSQIQETTPPWITLVSEAVFKNSLRLSPAPSMDTLPRSQDSSPGSSGEGSLSPSHPSTDLRPSSPMSEKSSSETAPKTANKDNTHILPLCKVCGVQATGFHYGVNTCEACKGFFHRSIGRQTEYRCYKNSRCEIKQGGRSFCPRCRFRKCLDVGMSKEGIKTGRYTYEKRTRDIIEVKKQRIEAVTAKEDERSEQEERHLDDFIASVVKAKERLLSELQVIEDTGSTIIAMHHDDPEHQLHLPRYTPDMEPNADMIAIWRKWVGVLENSGGLQRLIKFVKTIPGFRELDMTDQIQLIKHSFCELWVVSKHHKFDILRKCYTNNFGFTFNLIKALGEDYAEHVLAVSDRLQLMELTSEETCLLTTYIIFATDRCQLLQPVKVEQIAGQVLSALIYTIRKQHPHDRLRFARFTAVITELRTITDHYHKHNEHILSDVGQISPLLWEIFNLS